MRPFLNALLLSILFLLQTPATAENIYQALPAGKYAVGFKIITITDSTRISKPEYNYLGEKNEGDRLRKITIHLWYPAIANSGNKQLTYGDYCYSHLLNSTAENIDTSLQNAQVKNSRRSVENWFGKTTDADWQKLTGTQMIATSNAAPLNQKFPLLIGMLRPLSTTITNEALASNGYVVAMVRDNNNLSFAEDALLAIPDMQYALTYLGNSGIADITHTGTFGFSGSGFIQVLFAMFDARIKAVADIESGIYMDGLYQQFSVSNYYKPAKLRAPFLHIFSRDLSKQEKYIDDFEHKTNFSKRYRLLLNQPAMHHWDFAAEGYTACLYLHNRGSAEASTERAFETANIYLLNFLNAQLKDDAPAAAFLAAKPALPQTLPTLWDVTVLNADRPAPEKDELEHIIRTRGIQQAITIAQTTLKTDSAASITQPFTLNTLGYTFFNEKKYPEAIGLFTLNTELHPDDANLFDSLAEGYEAAGDTQNMKTAAAKVLELLNKKATLNDNEKALKASNERRVGQ